MFVTYENCNICDVLTNWVFVMATQTRRKILTLKILILIYVYILVADTQYGDQYKTFQHRKMETPHMLLDEKGQTECGSDETGPHAS